MLIYKFLIFFKVTEAAREIARKLANITASGDKLKWLLEEKNYQINFLQRLSKLLVWRSFAFYKNKQTAKKYATSLATKENWLLNWHPE